MSAALDRLKARLGEMRDSQTGLTPALPKLPTPTQQANMTEDTKREPNFGSFGSAGARGISESRGAPQEGAGGLNRGLSPRPSDW